MKVHFIHEADGFAQTIFTDCIPHKGDAIFLNNIYYYVKTVVYDLQSKPMEIRVFFTEREN